MKTRTALAFAIVLSLGASALSALPATAQSRDALIEALARNPRAVAADPDFVRKMVAPETIRHAPAATFSTHDLRRMATRTVGSAERRQLAAAVEQYQLPSVDMEIYFTYDSAVIDPNAYGSLSTLGQALSDPRLRDQTFLIAGHTDASGSNGYNQQLSERRAWSVKAFLVANFAIDPESLIAVGYGEENLKDRFDPVSGVNRRVQLVNLEVQ
ncbi:OmpA family protein [Bauldia litoralis]|uniref:OmpA family protein n=1 Tax=Bauldia litoralis TaxID=665467 RepID=UPI0032672C79